MTTKGKKSPSKPRVYAIVEVLIDHKVLAFTDSVRVTFLSFLSLFLEATLIFRSINAKSHSELSTLPIRRGSLYIRDHSGRSERGQID